MELSYHSKKIRKAALDQNAARKILGSDLARSFHSLLADMRDAAYLGELPDAPIVDDSAGYYRLSYRLESSTLLIVQPIEVGAADGQDWSSTHRVKLLNIASNGKALL